MTFLQQTLGKSYKWWYLINHQFKASSGHLPAFLTNTTIRTVEFLAIVYIWKINNSLPSVITYLAIGRVFDKLSFMEIDGQISFLVNRGGLTRLLLIPSNFFGYMTSDNIGFNLFRSAINCFIIFVLALAFFNSDIILSTNIIYLVFFFFISYTLKTLWAFVMGSISFWSRDNASAISLIEAVRIGSELLSGAVIPLFFVFTGSLSFLLYTPFAFMLHHPMQIYLGKYSTIEIIYTFLGGIAWCFVLWILARATFKLGLKKNEAVGL
jgi:ABC-2 type transport system permease protein